MAREKIETLYKKAIRCAKIHGHPDIAEDFAGWITVKWLEGKSQHQTLDYAFIDFLRIEYGGTGRHRGGDALLRSHRQQETSLPGCDEPTIEESLERMLALRDDAGGDHSRPSIIERSDCDPRRYLSDRFGEIWQKYFVEEATLKEVAAGLGITESRASQLATIIKRQIENFEGLRAMNHRIESGKSKLEIEWITL